MAALVEPNALVYTGNQPELLSKAEVIEKTKFIIEVRVCVCVAGIAFGGAAPCVRASLIGCEGLVCLKHYRATTPNLFTPCGLHNDAIKCSLLRWRLAQWGYFLTLGGQKLAWPETRF